MTKQEELGRQIIRDLMGGPEPARRFDYVSLLAIRDHATKRFIGYPTRTRLDGMVVDLDESERRILAFFEASIEVANMIGLVTSSKMQETMPRLHSASQEVNDEGIVGHNFTPQK